MDFDSLAHALRIHDHKMVVCSGWVSCPLVGATIVRDGRAATEIIDSGDPVTVMIRRNGDVWFVDGDLAEPIVVVAESKSGQHPARVLSALRLLGLADGPVGGDGADEPVAGVSGAESGVSINEDGDL